VSAFVFHVWRDAFLCPVTTERIDAIIAYEWASKLPEDWLCPVCLAAMRAERFKKLPMLERADYPVVVKSA
jgi:hypothetical protein